MKLWFKFSIILFILGCKEIKEKKYGQPIEGDSSYEVIINIDNFEKFGQLTNRILEFSCSDSIPKIQIRQKNSIANLYINLDCDPIPFDPKSNYYLLYKDGNFIGLENDVISNSQQEVKEYFESNFIYPKYDNSNSSPFCYLIIIEASKDEKTAGLSELINNLIIAYDALDTNLPLIIHFWNEVSPPPQAPTSI
ncbi:MAG: hypothetical protein KGZ81_05455 [Flavobacteriales bacterium]|nr:hypothetical protein [Flavobacteriales bacterium]MBS4040028.1 hypothetical protein [Flavobacteriales bacterium]